MGRMRLLAPDVLGNPVGSAPLTVATLEAWWAARLLSGFANNDPVGTWTDLSPSARDATQATAGARPLFKTGQVNGLPAIEFDGTDDALGFTAIPFGSSYMTGTVFIVAKGHGDFYLGAGVGANRQIGTNHPTPPGMNFYDGTTGHESSTLAVDPASAFSAMLWRFNGGNVFYYQHGIAYGADGFGGNLSPINTMAMTVSVFTNPILAEVLIYSTYIAAADCNVVGQYLADIYGFSWTAVT